MGFLKNLSPPQVEAVTYAKGPLLVLAGAGSGKTRVLTYRIAHVIEKLKVRPNHILAVTFTNKAAEEMRERVSALIGGLPKSLWLGTFHSACVRILRKDAKLLGYPRNFTIYDQTDQLTGVKRAMEELEIAEKVFDPKKIRAKVSWAKNHLTPPEECPTSDLFGEVVARVYKCYQDQCKANGAFDFDDLLMKTVELLRDFPTVLDGYSERFRHILVDEYQDTNYAQYTIVKLLSARHRNLCVVGDDDQSIYGFRGADISNILDFEKDFPDAKVVRLEENYRSTQNILAAASSVVSRNLGRKGKELWTRNETGEEISLLVTSDENDEANGIVAALTEESSNGRRPLRDFVVLYRTNAQSRVLEEAMRARDLPYLIVGGVRFYERKEIKDILAYLKVIQNPADSLSLRRIISIPRRGIGDKTIAKLADFALSRSVTLYEAMGRVEDVVGISSRAKSAITDVHILLEKYRKVRAEISVAELASTIVDEIGYLNELAQEGTREAEGRIENVKELLVSMDDFSEESGDNSLDAYLAKTSLFVNIDGWDDRKEAITLMTAHNAKGLEFPVVFICGLEEGLFPHLSSFDSPEELEEERRLLYVGLTRAENKVYLSYANKRRRFGGRSSEPSRFLAEIPRELIGRAGTVNVNSGDRVYHHLWGFAKVVDIEGQGEKQKATLLLQSGEEKRVVVKYAKLEVVNR